MNSVVNVCEGRKILKLGNNENYQLPRFHILVVFVFVLKKNNKPTEQTNNKTIWNTVKRNNQHFQRIYCTFINTET